MEHPRSRTRSTSRWLAAPLVALVLALSACGGAGPRGATVGAAPTPAQLERSSAQATRVGEAFFHLLARGDIRACKLLDQGAAAQLQKATKADTCAQAVRAVGRRGGSQRKRLAALTFDQRRPTSRYRVELNHAGRPADQPLIAEYFGSRWVITSLG